jgi:hypothetical protein
LNGVGMDAPSLGFFDDPLLVGDEVHIESAMLLVRAISSIPCL